jgi:hypothetical protein
MYFLTSDGNTSVNIEGVACDVITSWIEGKESRHTSNLFWLSETLQWDSFRNLGL